MAKSGSQRLFFGLWPDVTSRSALYAAVPGKEEIEARWVHPDDLHMTLLFLGQIEEQQMEVITQAAAQIKMDAFELAVSEVQYWRRSRMLCYCPTEPPAELMILYSSLKKAIESLGLELDSRTYKPHVTLARKCLAAPRDFNPAKICWTVEHFTLFSSRTFGGPPRYTPIWSSKGDLGEAKIIFKKKMVDS